MFCAIEHSIISYCFGIFRSKIFNSNRLWCFLSLVSGQWQHATFLHYNVSSTWVFVCMYFSLHWFLCVVLYWQKTLLVNTIVLISSKEMEGRNKSCTYKIFKKNDILTSLFNTSRHIIKAKKFLVLTIDNI